jgi:UDP-2-acetamido-2-deoxy-ribo-hexuluronate aminotransferase
MHSQTMQFIDLQTQYRAIENSIQKRINQVLEHGKYIMGPEVSELEAKLAALVGVKHCVTVSSGTDALLLALMALGIKPGDEIITTPFSFFASASMGYFLGATPIFVDIDPKTYNLDPALIEAAITSKTKAILAVNLYGQCADYDAIAAIAEQHGLFVVEDAAQSLGATYKGRASGSLGDISCTSFYPSKPLGCYGDGGACFTDDDFLVKQLQLVRDHGQATRYQHVTLGINGRLDTLQAAILLAKLDIFDAELQSRIKIAEKYTEALAERFITPYIEPYNISAFAQYTLLHENRDAISQYLQGLQIPTAIHYPVPLHKQPIFAHLPQKSALSVTERIAKQVISLPFHPYMENHDVDRVVEAAIQFID